MQSNQSVSLVLFLFNQFDAYSDDIYLFKNVVNILNSSKVASCLFVYHLSSIYLIFRSCISKMLNEGKNKQKEMEFVEGRRGEEGEREEDDTRKCKSIIQAIVFYLYFNFNSMVWLFFWLCHLRIMEISPKFLEHIRMRS